MPSKLKERLAQLGPVRGVDRVKSGSPADIVLRARLETSKLKTVDATMALARRGLTLLRAKRTIEAVLDAGETIVHVPMVENAASLFSELRAAGFKPSKLASGITDVRELRESLGLTQEHFALRFNLDLDAVQNWEQGRRVPDRAVQSYLRVIAREAEVAALAQEEDAA